MIEKKILESKMPRWKFIGNILVYEILGKFENLDSQRQICA